jgi:hypothetical protein
MGPAGSGAAGAAGASGTPAGTDGGRASAGGDGGMDPVLPPPPPGMMVSYAPPRVVVSELMYHPVNETTAAEVHEFVEIANRTDQPVAIGGWRLAGTIMYTLPAGTTIMPRQHLVIGKDPAAVATTWKLPANTVLGPYMGELDNNGGVVLLADMAGNPVDQVRYSDKAPWPIGGDAMGAGDAWLPAAVRGEAMHQYKGYSIERISLEISPQEPVNWTTSPLDGATPGKVNAANGQPQAIVEAAVGRPSGDPMRVHSRPGETTTIQVVLSARGTATKPRIEYFVDDVEKTDEAKTIVDLSMAGGGWQATVPALPDASILRYRVLADRGDGKASVIGPRATDPYEWYSHFAGNLPPAGKSNAYQLFINRAIWTRLWTNIQGGRVLSGQCQMNPTWNARAPAVLVYQGRVYDVQLRYQGSPYNRQNGPMLAAGAFAADKGPTLPSPLRSLGWHMWFPRYAPLPNGRRDLLLNKRAHECNFVRAGIGGMIFESIGVPSGQFGYARLFVNGTLLHFYSDVEPQNEEMLKRFFGKDHEVADFFKVSGWNGVQGPYTWADGRELDPATLSAACRQLTPSQLYTANYDRATPDWKSNSDEVMAMIKAFNVAKAAGTDAVRKFFMDTFDFPVTLSYLAVMSWMVPWDDFFQNHFLYKKPDGKWMFSPWDFDLLMGDWIAEDDKAMGQTVAANASFHHGVVGDRSNRIVGGVKWNNFIKDAFVKAFRNEYYARLMQLSQKELLPAKIDEYAAKQLANYDIAEAQASASKAVCNPASLVAKMKAFATARNARIAMGQFN